MTPLHPHCIPAGIFVTILSWFKPWPSAALRGKRGLEIMRRALERGILTIFGAGFALLGSCTPEFTSCDAKRSCVVAGAGGRPGAEAGAGQADSDAGDGGSGSGGTNAGGSTASSNSGGALSGGTSSGAGETGSVAGGTPGSTDSAGAAQSGGDDAGGADSAPRCGDGHVDENEECDLGDANRPSPYGKGLCTTSCSAAPYCGDGKRNGAEVCDGGGSDAVELGACNPECTGYYEKKYIRPTNDFFSTNLGGVAGADAKCRSQFGNSWKALLVGGNRRATVSPNLGDVQQDWVLAKYTYYYNAANELIWTTGRVALLGVRDGARQNLYADAFVTTGSYPWAGFGADWTTQVDADDKSEITCDGWTSDTDGVAGFVTADLMTAATEPCGSTAFILCVEQ